MAVRYGLLICTGLILLGTNGALADNFDPGESHQKPPKEKPEPPPKDPPQEAPKENVVVVWPLSYVRAEQLKAFKVRVPKVDDKGKLTGESVDINGLDGVMAKIFPGVTCVTGQKQLILASTNEKALKSAITFIADTVDIPQPQVRGTFWTIQVSRPVSKDPVRPSSSDLKIAQNQALATEQIAELTSAAATLLGYYRIGIIEAIEKTALSTHLSPAKAQSAAKNLADLGWWSTDETLPDSPNLKLKGPTPFLRALLQLAFVNRNDLHTKLKQVWSTKGNNRFADSLYWLTKSKGPVQQMAEDIQNEKDSRSALASLLIRESEQNDQEIVLQFLRRIARNGPSNSSAIPPSGDDSDNNLGNTVTAWYGTSSSIGDTPDNHWGNTVSGPETWPGFQDWLVQKQRTIYTSQIVDAMLENLTRAIDADLERIIYRPLRKAVQRIITDPRTATGMSLLGTTSLVASNRESSSLRTSSTFVTPYTVPPNPGDLLPSKAGNPATGLLEVFEGVGNVLPQEAFLLGALLNRGTTTYKTIAPGVTIQMLPSISADATSASLALALSFAGGGSGESSGNADAQSFDSVRDVTLETQVEIRSNDLIGLSTMALQTAIPGDRNNFLFFPGKRRLRTVEQSLIVLASLSITPRAMDLASRGAARAGN